VIYFAGPLTKEDDADYNTELTAYLRHHGFKVYLPQEIGRNADYKGNDPTRKRLEFCKADVAAMNMCNVCFINLHRDCSAGTAFEAGYMYAQHKAIVIYTKLDAKTIGTMLVGTCIVLDDMAEVANYLKMIGE